VITRRVVFVTAVLVATAVLAPGGPAGATVDGTYAALGDSFAAGPLIPNQIDPLGCLKSDHDYAHVAAPLIGETLEDVTCSGATTGDMFEPQDVFPGPQPAQLDALDTATEVVTLTVGGNDIGFADIVLDCVTVWPFGSPCKDEFTGGGSDEISERIAATAPLVASVLSAIHERAPQADVFVVGYVAILPDRGRGCWPTMPIALGDVPYLRAKHRELNAMLAARAAAGGATYVDVYTPSIGHDACAGVSNRWVEPVVPAVPAAPVHPNANGMANVGAIIAATINAS
jgi:lysophospholipase L1-like esterase